MKLLDGRHRWEQGERKGARITYTCRACGLVNTYETMIPEVVVEELVRYMSRPNPYRELFR